MNIVKFPLLNLELKFSDIAFTILGMDIYWYAVMIVTAIIIALLVLKIREKLFNIKFSAIIDLCIYLIPISIISARIYYVIFSLSDYISSPLEIFNIRNGILAIYGGIIGGIITCYIFCRKRKINFIELLDYTAPSLAIRTINRKMGEFL